MSNDRKCKTVSFDLTDDFEADLLQHAEQKGKFSKYVKRLIQRDREGGAFAAPSAPIIEVDEIDEDAEAMAGFI